MTMRETALGLARRGFKVFPLRAGQKTPPLIKAWEQLATSDAAQVTSWWTQWPEANVGIHCDGLLVIDVDPKKGGFDSLAILEQEIQLESTYETETPSGGRHIYYRCADDVRNGVDVLGRGVDVRAMGGYVVGAGSKTATGEYRVVVDDPIAPVDSQVVERVRAPSLCARDSVREDVATDADAAVARSKDFLASHPVAVQGQGGDHHTFRTVCRIRDFGVPQERALEALEDWNARCNPPWDERELTLKIENAYTYAQDAAGKLTPEALGFEIVPNSGAIEPNSGVRETSTNVLEKRTELMHPADVTLDEVLNSEYLIKGVLEKQSNAVLFGQWNVGKTFVILDMAASIACGERWFGKRVRRGRVLYLGYEGLRAMKKRLKALRGKYPTLNDKAVPFRYEGMIHPLTRPEGVKEVGAILKQYAELHGGAPDLVIIDPLANALGGDDADAALMGELNRFVAMLMKKQQCTVLRVHHSGHGNQDRARGHSSLPAGVDTEIRVTEQEIALTKQRDDVRGTLYFKLDVVKLGQDSDGDPVTTCVVGQIEDNALSPELSRPQREALDTLVKMKGEGGHVTKTELMDSMPVGTTPAKKREIAAVLERKMYLRPDTNGWVIVERGPMAMFD